MKLIYVETSSFSDLVKVIDEALLEIEKTGKLSELRHFINDVVPSYLLEKFQDIALTLIDKVFKHSKLILLRPALLSTVCELYMSVFVNAMLPLILTVDKLRGLENRSEIPPEVVHDVFNYVVFSRWILTKTTYVVTHEVFGYKYSKYATAAGARPFSLITLHTLTSWLLWHVINDDVLTSTYLKTVLALLGRFDIVRRHVYNLVDVNNLINTISSLYPESTKWFVHLPEYTQELLRELTSLFKNNTIYVVHIHESFWNEKLNITNLLIYLRKRQLLSITRELSKLRKACIETMIPRY